jgi:ribose transport system ATP-binding protein
MSASPDALDVAGISKTFGATRALDDVGFAVPGGTVHGLLGGNGSGKSTLIKILAGVQRADDGTFERGGVVIEADRVTPEAARDLGLRFVHQNPAVFEAMTVADNIALGAPEGYPVRLGAVRDRRMRRETTVLLERFELRIRPDELLGDLRPADRMMVAIARALSDAGPDNRRLLVLDEPTASLPHHEVDVLLAALRRCVSEGHAILYVSHRLEEVMELVDGLTVLRDGTAVVTRPRDGLDHAALVEYITGRPMDAAPPGPAATVRERATVLRMRGVRGGVLTGIDLAADAGEIVGIAGLLGSGRSEVLRTAFGDLPLEEGEMQLGGRDYAPATPADAMAAGVAYVPEDRAAEAAFGELSVSDNLAIARLAAFAAGPRVDDRRARRESERIIGELGVKTAGPDALMSSLSGGNQQKVVVGRWLARSPRLLLLDEPTQGVDIGARGDIYAAVRRAVAHGMAAILVASDFEELAAVADRVIVLRAGRIVRELTGELTAHRITDAVYAEEIS